MAGIYIHIPFCKQACYYCNFHFSTSLRLKDEMIHCLKKELLLHTDIHNAEICGMILENSEVIESLYFGGGTPSILPASDISELITSVRNSYTLRGDAEITLEANPDDITPKKLREWKDSGINRLSVGIQSFKDENLKWMNRAHNAQQAFDCINWIEKAGFSNYSVDLIFGIPKLTDEEWNDNIDTIIKQQSPHISCYALTVEPKTALFQMIRLGKKEDISQEDQARQFEILMQRLREAGYEHYEISNFALKGFRSKHNSSYWQQKKYLGIGPSAHSYDGNTRYWNIANNPLYIKSFSENTPFFEKEKLTDIQKFDEYILTTLRTIEGMDLKYLANNFGKEHLESVNKKIQEIPKEWYRLENDTFTLTDKGKLFADRISVIFFD